jgi:ABC-2 type transport system permease protein
LAGWGEYFPWAVPGLLAQGGTSLSAASYWVVVLTGLVGMLVTYLWWMRADQNR